MSAVAELELGSVGVVDGNGTSLDGITARRVERVAVLTGNRSFVDEHLEVTAELFDVAHKVVVADEEVNQINRMRSKVT